MRKLTYVPSPGIIPVSQKIGLVCVKHKSKKFQTIFFYHQPAIFFNSGIKCWHRLKWFNYLTVLFILRKSLLNIRNSLWQKYKINLTQMYPPQSFLLPTNRFQKCPLPKTNHSGGKMVSHWNVLVTWSTLSEL